MQKYYVFKGPLSGLNYSQGHGFKVQIFSLGTVILSSIKLSHNTYIIVYLCDLMAMPYRQIDKRKSFEGKMNHLILLIYIIIHL